MMRRLPAIAALVLLSWTALVPVPRASGETARPPLAVVVGASMKMTDVTLALLRTIFRNEAATAPDGKRFVPVNAPLKTWERELFDRKVLGLGPDEVGQFWINRRIRDEGLPPRTLPSADLGQRVAASYPGAIAYVAANTVGAGVRVLKIDGKLPSDSGYLLSGP